MVNCPNCGTQQSTAIKNWTITPIKREDTIITPEIYVSVYECPKCKAIFKSATPAQFAPSALQGITPEGQDTFSGLIQRLTAIRSGLIQNRNNLRRNLEILEAERSGVLFEMETFRRDAESKAEVLEDDITRLREEIRCLRELLGLDTEEIS